MDDKSKKEIDQLLLLGRDNTYIRNRFINNLSFQGSISEIDSYLSSKKKEEVAEDSLGQPEEITSGPSGSELAQEPLESTGGPTESYEFTDYLGDITPGEMVLTAAQPLGLVTGYAAELSRQSEEKIYGGAEQYRKYFKDTQFSEGFDSSVADKISVEAKKMVKQISPEMVEAVNTDEDFLTEIKDLKEKYTVGNTIKTLAPAATPYGSAMVPTDTIVTQEMRNKAIEEARTKALNDQYYKTIDTSVKSQVLEMIPEEYRDDKEFLEYLTDKIYTEQEIDLDLDGDGRLKNQGVISYVAKNLQFGTEDLVTNFVDALDYVFTGGDQDLAQKRKKQLDERSEGMMEFSRGISSSLSNGDYANAAVQMGGAVANTLPILGVTMASGGLGGAAVIGVSGGGGAYTEALNDPEYGDSIGGRVGYAVANGVGDFLFAAIGNELFKSASAAALASTTAARQSAIIGGTRFTKEAIAAYARRNGLAFTTEAFEEAATNVMVTYVEAIGKGKSVDLNELLETTIDAALVGGVVGSGFSSAGSISGNSKALIYARANATATRAVEAEERAAELREEASKTEDESKKRKLLMMADGLTRDAERARESRTGFYHMLQARHPEAAKKLMELDVEIESLARQMRQEGATESEVKALEKTLKATVKNRVDLERTFDAESLNLTSEEKNLLFENTRDAIYGRLDQDVALLEMALEEHIDMEGTESYDPDARAIAEKNLSDAKAKRESTEGLVNALKEAEQDFLEASAPVEGFDEELSQMTAKAYQDAAAALAKETGLDIKAFGGLNGNVASFLDVQDQITMRYSGQWLVDQVKGLSNSSLTNESLRAVLSSENWAMLTGENPSGIAVGEAANARFNERAEKWLKLNGLKYHKIVGRYGAGENSFLVEGMTREQSAEFAKLMGQESVAHKDGLVQADGSINLFEEGEADFGSEVDAKSDFMSVIKDKDGNIISFSFMPSSTFQDSEGNTISEEDYAERTKANKVSESDIEARADAELETEIETIDEMANQWDPNKENGGRPLHPDAVSVPRSKDGKASLREGDAGLSAPQVKVINNLFNFMFSSFPDVKLFIHPNLESAAQSGMDSRLGGVQRGNEIHINLESISLVLENAKKANAAARKAGKKVVRDKTFQETLLEEVGHLIKFQAIRKTDTKGLLSGAQSVINLLGSDKAMSNRIARKIITYAEGIQGGKYRYPGDGFGATAQEALDSITSARDQGLISESEYRMLLEEAIEDGLSAASGERGVKLGLVTRAKLIFREMVLYAMPDAADFMVTSDESFIRMVAVMKAAKRGRYVSFDGTESSSETRNSSIISFEESLRRQAERTAALPHVSPTKLKPNSDGKVKVVMQVPTYRTVRGVRKDIGSHEITKTFNDSWHFINWWKKATDMGQKDYYTSFRTPDGEVIDVDDIKSYQSRSSMGLGIGADADIALHRIKAAESQGIIDRITARRMTNQITNFRRRFEYLEGRNSPNAAIQESRLKRSIRGVNEIIEGQEERTGKKLRYTGDTNESRYSQEVSMFFQDQLGEKEYRMRYDEFMDASESFFGRKVKNMALDHQFLGSLMRNHFDIDYDRDSPEVTAKKLADAYGAIYKRYNGDPEMRKASYGTADPFDFYKNSEAETYALVDQMIKDGDLNMGRKDAFIHMSILQAITSQRNGANDNIMAASVIAYESGKGHSSSVVDEFVINGIGRVGGAAYGFVNGMVSENVINNLKKYNALAKNFTNAEGVTDFNAILEYLSTNDGQFSQATFGDKIGAFALNLNGSDIVQTFDSHNISAFRVGMGRHVDFIEAYSRRRERVQQITGEYSNPESELRALKGVLHDMIESGQFGSKEYMSVARLYNSCANPPESSFNNKERDIANRTIKIMSEQFGVEGRDICQLFFADHQVLGAGLKADANKYEDFGSPLIAVREEKLYKQSESARVKRAILESQLQNDLLADAFEARIKSQSSVVGARESVDASVDSRASIQLRMFDLDGTKAEDSPLYRSRKIEEVGVMRDGRIISNPITDEALSTDATSKRIIAKESVVNEGQQVGIRLNLNVMKNTGVPVQTMHDKSASGEALRYSPAVTVRNPVLYVNQGARKKIATFQENKFPMASVNGEFMTDQLDGMNFDGVKAFFNPFKQNVFVDASGRPIKSAEEATIIGSTVILRGEIEYYDFNDPVLEKGRVESDEEKAKRIKRGPKYDKAVNRFVGFSKAQGVEFASKEEAEEAYDNMSFDNKVALDNSEVARNIEENSGRASRDVHIRRTAGRAARRYTGDTRKNILENPRNYITPQNIKQLKGQLFDKSDSDLVGLMSNEGLGRLQNRNDDLGVLAISELINRAVGRGDFDAIPGLIEEASAIGTTAGRILRHFRELKGSTPRGIEEIIIKEVERRGNSLSEEQTNRLKSIAGNLFRVQAEHEALVKRAIAGEDVDAELAAKAKEVKDVERELDTFTNAVVERGWGQIGTMLIQGNLLTPMSQITNVGANMVNALGKVAVDAIALPVERLINVFGIESPMKRNYSINAYMYGIRKFGAGFVEALDGIVTGQEKEVSEWRVHRGFAPFRSLMSAMGKGDLPMGPDGKASLSQRLKLLAQGTLGIPAEVMFRFLSLGDVPFRRYVEGIELYQAGKAQGLEGEALTQFIKHPTKKQREAAEREGRKLTYQEETGASRMAEDTAAFFERAISKGFDWIPGIDGKAVAKFLVRSNMPYIRTPANILLDTLTYVSPYVAGPRIMKDLQNGDARSAAQNFGKVMVGSMVSQTAVVLLKEGLISGALDWTEDEEKNIAYDQFPPNSINVSGLQRFLNGESTAKQPDDRFVSYTKLGVMGAIIGAIIKGVDKDEIKSRDYNAMNFPIHAIQDSFGVGAFSSIAYMMDQSFMQGMNTLVDVISSADATDFEKNFENWFRTTFQAVSATVLPNTLSAVYRGSREYLPDTRITKDMTVSERLLTRMAYTIKDRTFGLGDVPVRVNWKGEPITQTPRGTTGIAYQLFDITKSRQGEADSVSNEIWRLYEQTEDLTEVVGTPGYAATRKFNVPNIKKKHLKMIKSMNKDYSWVKDEAFMAERIYLSVDQMNRLMEASGKERYAEVEAFMATEKYSKMDDEERVEALNEINGNYNSAIEMNRNRFREHTKVLLDIMQEVYESER